MCLRYEERGIEAVFDALAPDPDHQNLALPVQGTEVIVFGISRFDYGHKHWEIHPS